MTFINRTSLVWKYSRCYPWCTYVYEINDIIFFIRSYKEPTTHFNINDYLQFSFSNTKFGSSSKLIHHRCSTKIFIFIVYPTCGTPYQLLTLPSQLTLSSKSCTYTCGRTFYKNLGTIMPIPTTTSATVAATLASKNLHFTTSYCNMIFTINNFIVMQFSPWQNLPMVFSAFSLYCKITRK